MKKKFCLLLCALVIFSALPLCGALAEAELAGAWDDDSDELSLVFDGAGGVVLSDEVEFLELIYEWDGEGLTISDVDGEVFLSGGMDADGDLVFEELEGYFYRVDEAYYVPVLGWDGSSLPGSEWVLEEIVFDFCWDGSVLMDGEYAGAYYWDGGQYAELYLDEVSVPLSMDETGLYFEDEDGEIQAFDYFGGVTLLSGAFDNDEEEVSIVFYLDESFTLSDLYASAEGEYALSGDGSLYLETGDGSWSGRYDAGDDGVALDGMDGDFYRVSEPEYVPEPEIIGDPEESWGGEGIAGTAWDFPDSEGSMIFNEDGTGAQTSPWGSIDFEYSWDGETLEISTEWMTLEGWLDADGNLVIGDETLIRVESASYVPGMYSGGMEGELEGEWIHESGYILLAFDGKDSVSYQVTNDEDNLFGAGTYSYDGTTLTVSLMGDDEVEEHVGYVDEAGDIVLVLWGEEGRFARGDRSQLIHPVEEISGPAANLVGEWQNDETGDSVTFSIDGSVAYFIDGAVGFAAPFEHDGEALSFSDYAGHLDEAGNMVLDGVEHWFTRAEAEG